MRVGPKIIEVRVSRRDAVTTNERNAYRFEGRSLLVSFYNICGQASGEAKKVYVELLGNKDENEVMQIRGDPTLDIIWLSPITNHIGRNEGAHTILKNAIEGLFLHDKTNLEKIQKLAIPIPYNNIDFNVDSVAHGLARFTGLKELYLLTEHMGCAKTFDQTRYRRPKQPLEFGLARFTHHTYTAAHLQQALTSLQARMKHFEDILIEGGRKTPVIVKACTLVRES